MGVSEVLQVVTPAWATDAFGVATFFNLIVQLFLFLAGGVVTIVGVAKGIRIALSHGGAREWVEEIIILGIGIGVIVGSPALSRAAITGAGGAPLHPVLVYSLSQDIGDALGWLLTMGASLLPGMLLWQWGQGRRGRHADAR